jgi:hypothetical protein
VSIHESTERQLGATPDLVRGKVRGLTRDFLVKVDGMAESQRPEIALIMLRPLEGGIYHDGLASANGVLDCVFGDTIVVMAPNATALGPLSLGGQFGGELLGRVDLVVSTICLNVDTGGGGFTLEPELGLNSIGAGETNLVDHSEFSTGSITEDGAAKELLRG